MFSAVARVSRLSAPIVSSTVRLSQRYAHSVAQQGPRAKIPVTFVSMDGQKWTVEGLEGETLLETAQRTDIPIPGQLDETTQRKRYYGMIRFDVVHHAELAGMCNGGGFGVDNYSEGPACRSCHIYVDNAHLNVLPPKGDEEEELTRFIKNKNAHSRFACEIILEPSLKGMTVVIPDYPQRP